MAGLLRTAVKHLSVATSSLRRAAITLRGSVKFLEFCHRLLLLLASLWVIFFLLQEHKRQSLQGEIN